MQNLEKHIRTENKPNFAFNQTIFCTYFNAYFYHFLELQPQFKQRSSVTQQYRN